MAIQHKDIADADRHEVKGATGATINHVLRSDGDGTTSFVDPGTLANIEFVSTLTNSRTAAITPSAVDTALQATFDGTTSNTDITMANTGTITINTTALYHFQFNLNFGRSTATGTAVTVARVLLNDVQVGFTQGATQAAVNTNRPVRADLFLKLNAGDTLKVQVMRDSTGANDGGLVAIPVTPAAWGDVPSFFVRGSRIRGGV